MNRFSTIEHSGLAQNKIQRAFDRAAHHYYDHCYGQSAASLQKHTARLLINELKPQAKMEHLIDLGCGMGVHWSVLKLLAAFYTGIDLSPVMIKEARKRCQPVKQISKATSRWIVGDAQAMPIANASADIVFSNLALQWCNNRSAVAKELFRVCKQNGRIYFSTLVAGSLAPLQHLQQIGLLRAVNEYPAAIEWGEQLSQAGFNHIRIKQVEVTTFHSSGAELLRSMKNIGASKVISADSLSVTESQGLRTPHWLMQVNNALEQYRQESGIPLTYQVALVSACK